MNLSEYQKLAMRTSPTGHDRVKNGCMGLMGESGEIVDVLKKYLFQSGENPEFPADRLTDECGDVLWYCAELMEGLDIPLAAIDAYAPTIPPYVHKLPIESVAQYLVFVSSMLYRIQNFDGVAEDEPDAMPEMRRKNTVRRTAQVVDLVETLLERCGSSLEDAMRRNIDKLKARYPEGFDPERSMHRLEGA
jgi:NTP pyrophosphatase (non-canonical NTP hydrolase)